MAAKTTMNASGTSTDRRNFVVGTISNTSPTVSSVSSADLAVLSVGDAIVHPAFPARTKVVSKSSSSFVVSENATASALGADIPFINRLNQLTKQVVTPAGGSPTTWTYTYNANGQMTGKTDGTNSWVYTWDPDEPRLTRVQGPGGIDVSYTYGSAGRMLTRTSGGSMTLLEWDGWTCVKDTTGSVVTRYIAPQGQIHSFERGGQVYQVHTDAHNGTVRVITDSTGAVVAHYKYDAWGNQLGSSSAFAGGFAYLFVGTPGVRYDSQTGLHYMRQRWYDAGLGRFLSRDPIGIRSGFNLYAYVNNNPVNFVDPSGLDPRTQQLWLNKALNFIENTPGYEDYGKMLGGRTNKMWFQDLGASKNAGQSNTLTGNTTFNLAKLGFLDTDPYLPYENLREWYDCGKISKSEYARRKRLLDLATWSNVLLLAETMVHEGRHAKYGEDEDVAYKWETDFLEAVARPLNSIPPNLRSADTTARLNNIRSMHNDAVRDAWDQEGVRVPGPTY